MRYKWISRIAKGFVYMLTILIVLVVVLPVATYLKKPNSNVNMKQYSDDNAVINWLTEHYKIESASLDKIPNLLIVKDSSFIRKETYGDIYHNVVILEALFQQVVESPYLIERLNYLTGVNTRNYTGKTYQDLAEIEQIPTQIVMKYKQDHNGEWPFYGEGIIISDPENVIVLVKGKDYKGTLKLTTEVFGKNIKIPFYGMFEITEGETTSMADFNLVTTSAGDAKLEQYRLKNQFPAVYQISRPYFDGYYLAGDFTANAVLTSAQYDLMVPLMQHKFIYEKFTGEQVFWQFTVPFFEHAMEQAEMKRGQGVKNTYEGQNINLDDVMFKIEDKTIYKKNELGTFEPFFMKGVNLGAALPGRFFTEFPQEKSIYLDWLNQMSELNINTIRVYTLLPPSFYQAFYEYNQQATSPLYLLQEIWPEEHPEDLNYLAEAYNQIYREEIEYAVHAIHGNIEIPERLYRAYGLYAYDVSPYVLGYLVGREMEPDEVIETDRLNKGYQFSGEYLYSERSASPTESWLAASCDYALSIEFEHYGMHPLVGIVNWPTLDELSHDSEWNALGDKSLQFNDKVSVDIDRIGINRENVSGFFGAYHIYPNYPNFMNNDIVYAQYHDEKGIFRYGGYLEAFMNQNHRYPAVVAEYGISTSAVTAHYSPDGLHHGGMTETEQADDIIRMTNAIIEEDYSGAIIFEWMDEWAKKTWTTEFYMIPYERHVLWHNTLDPEQNYGLIAYEAESPKMKNIFTSNSSYLDLERVDAGQNESYIYLDLIFKTTPNLKENLRIAIDLDVKDQDDHNAQKSYEYLLKLKESPELLVAPSYNWVKGHFKSSVEAYEDFEPLIQLVNPSNMDKNGIYTPERTINLSQMNIGELSNSQNSIWMDQNKVTIRIPYGLLGISDPSSSTILWDENAFIPSAIDQIKTTQIETINLRVMKDQMRPVDMTFTLENWEVARYNIRFKSGFYEIGQYFKEID